MHMNILSACMHMNYMDTWSPQTSEREMELPEIGFTNGCKLFCGSWEPLQEQQTLFNHISNFIL